DFFLPFQWQIQFKDSVQWLPLKSVLDTAFSTQTDTHLIQLLIPNASLTLDQCKIRLRVERCEGVWSESTPQLVRIHKDTGEFVVFPNPTMDEFVVRPATNKEVRIFTAYGRLQFTGRANETISTKAWDEGIYWIQLESESAVKTIAKLVVLH
ncbi:MAG: T9SS type A sorting domain-containing protein, partial [Bacteroidota bacterium]